MMCWASWSRVSPPSFGFTPRGVDSHDPAARECSDLALGAPELPQHSDSLVPTSVEITTIVAVLEKAATRHGDEATPTTFLSVQSDEARHMANGYATLAAIASVPEPRE